jgi:hypothetical protein
MIESASCSAQREALAVEALRSCGHLRLQVRGESMLPTLWPGDIAEIAACSLKEVRRSEIVLAFGDGRFFLHRFLAIGERAEFITRGDSMPGPDPAFPAGALLGRLVSVNRDGRQVDLRWRPWSRLMGLLFCYSSIARRAALTIRGGAKPQRMPATNLETA